MLAMFLIFLLSEPMVAAKGARMGLMLWANRLIPSLLPFMILTQLLMKSGYLDAITKKMHITYPYFVLFAGTLFGFPMGCKLTADLYDRGDLTSEEASLLFIISNQMSPAFIGGYILSETLHAPQMIPAGYLIFYAPAVCYGLLRLHVLTRGQTSAGKMIRETKKSTSGLRMNFSVLDAGIMNSFETMLKLGCYVMLFSIITSMCQHYLSAFPAFCTFTAGLLEVTGAVSAINDFFADTRLKYICMLTAAAFGGCSGIAQTASILRSGKKSASLSLAIYIKGRLLLAGITAALAAFICPLF